MQTHVKKTVLIIDDDLSLNRLMKKALQKIGYDVIKANHGKQAIEMLSEQQVDLIVLDLIMPEMDGLLFLKWLRQDAKSNTPALVLTGMAKTETESLVMAAGANALLFKPVKLPVFFDKIQELEKQL